MFEAQPDSREVTAIAAALQSAARSERRTEQLRESVQQLLSEYEAERRAYRAGLWIPNAEDLQITEWDERRAYRAGLSIPNAEDLQILTEWDSLIARTRRLLDAIDGKDDEELARYWPEEDRA